LFLARRIVIPGAEDVGLADPMALVLAVAAHQAAEFIGWPEARIPIAEAALYIATANKSNSVITAIDSALADVRSGRTLSGPESFPGRSIWATRIMQEPRNSATAKGINTRTNIRAISSPRIIWEPPDSIM